MVKRRDVAFVYHLACFLFHMQTLMWHTTEAALVLPGASGFGWFFRYLTFFSYTLQTVQLCLCLVTYLPKSGKGKERLQSVCDNLSCAAFGLANTVTVLFYTVESATKGLVEGGLIDRPVWLQFAVHAGNSLTAWGDLLLAEQRSFSPSSRRTAVALGLGYGAWLLVVRSQFGKFPYPILNKLPFPQGFIGFFSAGIAIILAFHQLGGLVRGLLVPGGAKGKQA